MAILQDLVQALLADLTRAQDNTNKLTRALAQEYQADAILQHLPIPNALLDEVQITLQFASEDAPVTVADAPLSSSAGASSAPTPSAARLRASARTVAQHIVDGLSDYLQSLKPETRQADALRQTLVDSLASPRVLRGVTDQVVAVLEKALRRTASGTAASQIGKILSELRSGATQLLTAEESFVQLVKDVDQTVEAVFEQSKTAIENAIQAANPPAQMLMGAGLQQLLTTQVTVDSKTLSGLSPQAVHSLCLKVQSRNYRWVVVSATEEPQLVPEG